jgi:hypothetical protein
MYAIRGPESNIALDAGAFSGDRHRRDADGGVFAL